MLRSLELALLEHDSGSPALGDAEPDRPWRRNLELARRIRAGWMGGHWSAAGTIDLLAALRSGSWSDACDQVVALLNQEISPGIALGCPVPQGGRAADATAGNRRGPLRDVDQCAVFRLRDVGELDAETRRLLLLQCAAFLVMFRERLLVRRRAARGPAARPAGAVGPDGPRRGGDPGDLQDPRNRPANGMQRNARVAAGARG